MKKERTVFTTAIFIAVIALILILRTVLTELLISKGIESYSTHMVLNIVLKSTIIIISIILIKKHGLSKSIGLSNFNLQPFGVYLFPLLYLPMVNILFAEDITSIPIWYDILLLINYCIIIGVSEELSIRGFLQTYLIKHFGSNKKNIIFIVFLTSIVFGALHFLKFDKGIYGELSQLFYATFIGVLFGILLLLKKRIFPLIIVHAIIDFFAKFDTIGNPITEKLANETSLESALLITAICLPYLIYALILIKKNELVVSVNK